MPQQLVPEFSTPAGSLPGDAVFMTTNGRLYRATSRCSDSSSSCLSLETSDTSKGDDSRIWTVLEYEWQNSDSTYGSIPLIPRQCCLSPQETYVVICGDAERSMPDWKSNCVVVKLNDKDKPCTLWPIPGGTTKGDLIKRALWHPWSNHHLIVLRVNNSISMYDLTKSTTKPEQRLKLPLSVGDTISSCCFEQRCSNSTDENGWFFSEPSKSQPTLFCLGESGAIYAACPLVPYGVPIDPLVLASLYRQFSSEIMVRKSEDDQTELQEQKMQTWFRDVTHVHYDRIISLARDINNVQQNRSQWVRLNSPAQGAGRGVRIQTLTGHRAGAADAMSCFWCDFSWISLRKSSVAVRVSSNGKIQLLAFAGSVVPQWEIEGSSSSSHEMMMKFDEILLSTGSSEYRKFEGIRLLLDTNTNEPCPMKHSSCEWSEPLDSCTLWHESTSNTCELILELGSKKYPIPLSTSTSIQAPRRSQLGNHSAQKKGVWPLQIKAAEKEFILHQETVDGEHRELQQELQKRRLKMSSHNVGHLSSDYTFPPYRLRIDQRFPGVVVCGHQHCFAIPLDFLSSREDDLILFKRKRAAPLMLESRSCQQGDTVEGCVFPKPHMVWIFSQSLQTQSLAARTPEKFISWEPQLKKNALYASSLQINVDRVNVSSLQNVSWLPGTDGADTDNNTSTYKQPSLRQLGDLLDKFPNKPDQNPDIHDAIWDSILVRSSAVDSVKDKWECSFRERLRNQFESFQGQNQLQKSKQQFGELKKLLEDNRTKVEQCCEKLKQLTSGPPLQKCEKFHSQLKKYRQDIEALKSSLRKLTDPDDLSTTVSTGTCANTGIGPEHAPNRERKPSLNPDYLRKYKKKMRQQQKQQQSALEPSLSILGTPSTNATNESEVSNAVQSSHVASPAPSLGATSIGTPFSKHISASASDKRPQTLAHKAWARRTDSLRKISDVPDINRTKGPLNSRRYHDLHTCAQRLEETAEDMERRFIEEASKLEEEASKLEDRLNEHAQRTRRGAREM